MPGPLPGGAGGGTGRGGPVHGEPGGKERRGGSAAQPLVLSRAGGALKGLGAPLSKLSF